MNELEKEIKYFLATKTAELVQMTADKTNDKLNELIDFLNKKDDISKEQKFNTLLIFISLSMSTLSSCIVASFIENIIKDAPKEYKLSLFDKLIKKIIHELKEDFKNHEKESKIEDEYINIDINKH